MTLQTTTLLLSLLTSLGGTIGYIRTKSLPSIITGLSIGFLYLLSYLRLRNNQPYGVEIAFFASLVLAGSSIPRAVKTGKGGGLTFGGLLRLVILV
ncbi:TMEM14 family protein [Aspergillus ibericus CBS 121593]|uniref:TMEM14-domain-containing protein n=1 Tax=Aspergillus ibericus CBS 121593 TaxID=1448316 RepID=A0A395GUI7_9EURO|nr:hypothetical protein BO80DRAFT_144835 [Aspergillus ibericus CBS 121593]RAK99082.1 hypothetical protein BO80DRAFT_144835 [Aspergillus ibericus CBS 121593]